jgi:hypothetical protein
MLHISNHRWCKRSHPSGCPHPTSDGQLPHAQWLKGKKKEKRKSYAVDVARGSLPLRISITAVSNAGEGVGHIRVEPRRLGEVELVAVPVGVSAAGVTRLRATGDGHCAAAGALEGDGALDGGCVDLLEGGAGGHVAVGAAARGDDRDAGGVDAREGRGVAELLGRDGRGQDGGDDGGELDYS